MKPAALLTQVIEATGYVNRLQLRRHFGVTPDSFDLADWMVWQQDAIWDGRRSHRGRHHAHWALRTDAYLAWHQDLTSWQCEPRDQFLIQPDALLTVAIWPDPIALEVDTGKETRRQWEQKLHRYLAAPDDWRLLVVATGGPRRLQRLAGWLESTAPRPWCLVAASHLSDWTTASWHEPAAPTVEPRRVANRPLLYFLEGAQISGPEAHSLLDSGAVFVGARERRAQAEYLHLQRR